MRYLLAFIIILNYFNVCGQLNEHTFKKVIVEIDGIQVLDVNHITQDHKGYMWLATNLGLVRYDGFEGKSYDTKKSEFSRNYIEKLYVDHDAALINSLSKRTTNLFS